MLKVMPAHGTPTRVKDVLHSFQSKDASKTSCSLLGIAWEPVPMNIGITHFNVRNFIEQINIELLR